MGAEMNWIFKPQIVMPFSNEIFVSTSSEVFEISIYDIASRRILQQKIISSVPLNMAQFEKGIYIYTLSDKNGVFKKGRIIKE